MTMCICTNFYIYSILELNTSEETEYRIPRDTNYKEKGKKNAKKA